MQYNFSEEKNKILMRERDICFEEVILALEAGELLDIVEHPNREKYPAQKMYVLPMNGYVYLVPFVEEEKEIVFLKTIFPSRKATKQYLD
ncbi:MAG: hypothetical protein DHS20C10_08020 [marine bacterium B5-7]|nr:MAG: hypothetical protein DHS20C10_08020 [marine bacterium B5-7]